MKIKKTSTILFAIVLFLSLSKCAPVYIPTAVNTPLFSEKGEVQAAVYGGTSGFDPQLAYSVTDHIGVMLNGSFRNYSSDSTNDYNKHQFAELGIGYYLKLSEYGRFEVYGGYGFGNIQAEYKNVLFSDYSNMSFGRVFIQPTIGFSNKIVDLGFATRFVIVSVRQDPLQFTESFLEPAFTARIGFKYVKFSTQIGYSFPLNSSIIFDYQPLMFSIGLHFTINKKYD